MDLGKLKLLRSGTNALFQAVHPVHGLAWTDGRQIVLTALDLEGEEAKLGNSVVIGHFEHVHGLHWGPVLGRDTTALLAVQHKKHVTIWKLFYDVLEKDRLVVSQTCEIEDPLPVLPQGCVWHPSKDILVILTKRDISVVHDVHADNASVKADIQGSGVIRCACWATDGCRVVVAIDMALHSYIWDDIRKTLSPCSFCPFLDIDATIYAIKPIMDNKVVITTETSTDHHTNLSRHATLDCSIVQRSGQELSMNNRRLSIDSGRSEPADLLKSPSLLPTDLSQILRRHRKSDPSPVVHFTHFSAGKNLNLSNLIIVSFEKNATTTRKVSVPGISTPDILVLDPQAQSAAIASNASNRILVYPVTLTCAPVIQEIKLEENEKTKGMYFLTDTTLLVLVGMQKANETAFIPSSGSGKYKAHLITKKVMPLEGLPACNGRQNVTLDGISSSPTPEKKSMCDNFSLNKELWIPTFSGAQSTNLIKKRSELFRSISCEQRTSGQDYKDNIEADPVACETLRTNQEDHCGELFHEQRTPDKYFSELDTTSVSTAQNLSNADPVLVDPHLNISEVKDLVTNYTKPLQYPNTEDPEYVSVAFENTVLNLRSLLFKDSPDDSEKEKRSFLLCHGKLQLRALRESFHLTNLEMKLGSRWITLTEDGEGFIPLLFRTNQHLIIQDAEQKTQS
ncbi:WD repeat and coiled-coil-containing protein-like [Spea bombifrons]|uniref:WD repeat and coiled-coil-containing protein-like n=1 Tax=Spea bombifrons TaxID=233779 RepID=UPI00234BFA86|nr:WD repeat and coiled-coil-containing protein-like [Spea bombifrons]